MADEVTAVPAEHKGPWYYDIMGVLSAKRSTKRYLEVGVAGGGMMTHIHTELAVGVDPVFGITANIMQNKKKVHLHKMPSDAFFADPAALASFDGPVELAFLDGMHTFEYLLRDFYNTEAISGPSTLVALHDCLPLNAEMAHRDVGRSVELGKDTKYPNYWTGDVWKVVPILKKYRPDLRLIFVTTPPTGLVFITNLDPGNGILKANYLEIVDEFKSIPNDLNEIDKMYQEIELIPGTVLMHEFDHSLYFRT